MMSHKDWLGTASNHTMQSISRCTTVGKRMSFEYMLRNYWHMMTVALAALHGSRRGLPRCLHRCRVQCPASWTPQACSRCQLHTVAELVGRGCNHLVCRRRRSVSTWGPLRMQVLLRLCHLESLFLDLVLLRLCHLNLYRQDLDT